MAESTPHWTNITQAYYPSVEKRSWYSDVAATYARVRPRYPSECLNQALDWANLAPGSHILELGCGPGTATVALAELGFQITALEPSQAACELAQARCQSFAQVEILNTAFEPWDHHGQTYDAVLAATSFHWLDPKTRCQKIAAVLKPKSALILLWNVPPQPQAPVLATMAPIYQALAPHLGQCEDPQQHHQAMTILEEHILASGYFESIHTHFQAWHLNYSVSDYVALLSTLSPYIALDPEIRANLLEQLEQGITQAWGEELRLDGLTAVQVTHKKT